MAAKRPYISFQEVKEKVSIPDALNELGLLDQFTERNGVWTGVCPLADHEHGPMPNPQAFKFDKRRGEWLWRCFGDCNRGGDVISLIKGIEQLDDAHVRLWFAQHFGDRLSTSKPKSVKPFKRTVDEEAGEVRYEQPPSEANPKQADGIKPLAFYLDTDREAAKPYLLSRGISSRITEHYDVGHYGKPSKMFTGYVVMPCYRFPMESDDENPIGYVGRWPGEDFNDDHPRWKVGFDCSNIVYALSEALAMSRDHDPLIVVESPLTVLWMADRGYPNTVSTFTASVSDKQAELLLSTNRPIVLSFDGDVAGQNGMRTAAAKLIKDTFVRVIALADGIDPDQLSDKDLRLSYEAFKPR